MGHLLRSSWDGLAWAFHLPLAYNPCHLWTWPVGLAKHRGHGIPFFGWYISGCILIDWLYAASLTLFKLMEPNL